MTKSLPWGLLMNLMKITLITMTLFCTQFAFAKQIGRVTKLKGKIFRTNVETEVVREPIVEGVWINEGDIIESEKASFMKVLMKDDTIFSVGPATKFAFEQFEMKTKNERTATYNLIKGKLRSVFTKKAPTRSLHIKTPTASMGVRGTEIVSDVYRVKGQLKTDIALIHGKLEVTTKLGKKFDLNPAEIFEAVDSNQMNKMAQKVLKGRSTASENFKASKRKMKKDVFEVLRKKPRKGGKVFLFDALHEGKKSGKGVEFHDMTDENKVQVKLNREEKDRLSIFGDKNERQRSKENAGVGPIVEKKSGRNEEGNSEAGRDRLNPKENSQFVDKKNVRNLKGSNQDNIDLVPSILTDKSEIIPSEKERKDFFKKEGQRGPASDLQKRAPVKDFAAPDIKFGKPDIDVNDRRDISIDQSQIKERIRKQANDPNARMKMQQTIKGNIQRQLVNDREGQAAGVRLPVNNDQFIRDQVKKRIILEQQKVQQQQVDIYRQQELEKQRILEQQKIDSAGTIDPNK